MLPILEPLVVEVFYEELPDPKNPLLLDTLADSLAHISAVTDGLVVQHESGFHATISGEPRWAQTKITRRLGGFRQHHFFAEAGSFDTDEKPQLEAGAHFETSSAAAADKESLKKGEGSVSDAVDSALLAASKLSYEKIFGKNPVCENQLKHSFAKAKGALIIKEELFGFLEPLRRVECLKTVLKHLSEITSPLGYWWSGTQSASDHIGFDEEIWHGIIGLRENTSCSVAQTNKTGWLIDTTGLSLFGLPDIECHFTGISTRLIGQQVIDRAIGMVSGKEYMANGDPVIITSKTGEFWFTAKYRFAELEPMRRVIALVPDAAHSLYSAEDHSGWGEPPEFEE